MPVLGVAVAAGVGRPASALAFDHPGHDTTPHPKTCQRLVSRPCRIALDFRGRVETGKCALTCKDTAIRAGQRGCRRASEALITQRSQVQILPPLQRSGTDLGIRARSARASSRVDHAGGSTALEGPLPRQPEIGRTHSSSGEPSPRAELMNQVGPDGRRSPPWRDPGDLLSDLLHRFGGSRRPGRRRPGRVRWARGRHEATTLGTSAIAPGTGWARHTWLRPERLAS